MLLKQIIAQLDAELDRLRALRSVVARLQRPALLSQSTPTPLTIPPSVPDAASTLDEVPAAIELPREIQQKKPIARLRRVEKPSVAQRVAQPGALTSSIPRGPVLVSAQAVARELDLRSKLRTSATTPGPENGEDLERSTRQLADRWAAGLKQARG